MRATLRFAPSAARLSRPRSNLLPRYCTSHQTTYATPHDCDPDSCIAIIISLPLSVCLQAWIKSPTGYPKSLHEKAFQAGITSVFHPPEFGGNKTPEIDAFYELIYVDEFARAAGGFIMGQVAIDSMAMPPIVAFGSDYIKNLVCRDVAMGRKSICLCISEPGAGSDVANIQASAKKTADGQHYVVNGSKKWYTISPCGVLTCVELGTAC